jgi:hypothetical protein
MLFLFLYHVIAVLKVLGLKGAWVSYSDDLLLRGYGFSDVGRVSVKGLR